LALRPFLATAFSANWLRPICEMAPRTIEARAIARRSAAIRRHARGGFAPPPPESEKIPANDHPIDREQGQRHIINLRRSVIRVPPPCCSGAGGGRGVRRWRFLRYPQVLQVPTARGSEILFPYTFQFIGESVRHRRILRSASRWRLGNLLTQHAPGVRCALL